MAASQLRANLHERLEPLSARCQRDHPEAMEGKAFAMKRLRPGSLIRERFVLERGLLEIPLLDKHCSPFRFKEEKGMITVACPGLKIPGR